MTLNESIQPPQEKSKTFKFLVTILTIGGIFGLVLGTITFLLAYSSDFSNYQLSDAIFNTVFSILLIVCSTIMKKGKVLVIWLFSGGILLSIIYGFAMGRGFNFIIAILGGLFIWQLFTVKKLGELT